MTTPAVVFSIGSDNYAVAATTVREVVCDAQTMRLPTASAIFLGAFNLRGEVVPIFDTARVLGVASSTDAIADGVIVVVETPDGPAGLAAGGMPKVVKLGEQVGSSELRGTLGMFAVGAGYAVLLDVPLLLSQSGVGAGASGELASA